MAQDLPAIYANVVNIRFTPGELVLEFGSFFPDAPGERPPDGHRPDVRIVLPIGAMKGFVGALNQAAEQRARGEAEVSKNQSKTS